MQGSTRALPGHLPVTEQAGRELVTNRDATTVHTFTDIRSVCVSYALKNSVVVRHVVGLREIERRIFWVIKLVSLLVL